MPNLKRRKIPTLEKSAILALIACLAIAAHACTYYRTTSRTAGDIARIAVPYFSNKTSEPDVEIEITDRIVEGIVRDNTLKVVEETEADAVLEGTVRKFRNTPFTFEQGETQIQAEQYRLFIEIEVSLFNPSSNSYIYEDKIIRGQGDYYLETAVDQNYENALEEVYRDLVEGILSATVQDW
jgi:hypothetical protein